MITKIKHSEIQNAINSFKCANSLVQLLVKQLNMNMQMS